MSTYGRHSAASPGPTDLASMPPLAVTTQGIPAQEHLTPPPTERWSAVLVWAFGLVLLAAFVFGVTYGIASNAGAGLPRLDVSVSHTYPAPTHHGV